MSVNFQPDLGKVLQKPADLESILPTKPAAVPEGEPQTLEQKMGSIVDKANLSAESLKLQASTELLEAVAEQSQQVIERIKEEAIEKAWKAILEYKPLGTEGKNQSEDLRNLREIFEQLEKLIVESFTSEEADILLQRLDKAMAQAVEKLMKPSDTELISYLLKYGQKDAAELVKPSIFHAATGRLPSESNKNNSSFFENAKQNGASFLKEEGISQMKKEIQQSFSTQQKQSGIYYQKGANGRVELDNAYCRPSANMKTTKAKYEAVLSERAGDAFLKTDLRAKGQKQSVFSLFELEQAGKFVKFTSEEKMPFLNAASAVQSSEEKIGFLAALAGLKARVFSEQSGIGRNMGQAIKASAGQVLFEYCFEVNKALKLYSQQNESAKSQFPPLETKSVFYVYNAMLESYDKTGNAARAVIDGLKWAEEEFEKKTGDTLWKKTFRYQQEHFWGSGLLGDGQKHTLGQFELLQAIRQNWNEFIRRTGLSSQLFLEFSKNALQSGAWAAALQPGKEFLLANASVQTALRWGAGILLVPIFCLILSFVIKGSFVGVGLSTVCGFAAVLFLVQMSKKR